jgi:fatty acid-binding protein DegV
MPNLEEDLEDTMDQDDLYTWIEKNTSSSQTGLLRAETVLEVYEEETEKEADYIEISRILASLYEAKLHNGELCFRAKIPNH